MEDGEEVVLLSVRPRFAEAILTGTKTAELRRTVLGAAAGSCVVLYASAPAMAVVGMARVARVDVGEPDEVWPAAKDHAAVARAEYDEYFRGARRAAILWLTDPVRFDRPLSLAQLRSTGAFHPPQSYRYLRGAELARFRALLGGAGSALPSEVVQPAQLALDIPMSQMSEQPTPARHLVSRIVRAAVARSLRVRASMAGARSRRAG
jgi:predicted transcriptional regulator